MAEWTGRKVASHRDADVYRFAIAQRVAREILAAPRKTPGQPQVQRRDGVEVMTASARRDGPAAFLAMIRTGPRPARTAA